MTNVSELIFRQITPADFFNINKQPGAEEKGGGQSYIDVPVNHVDLPTWHSFFAGIEPTETQSGPLWNVEIHSLGELGSQSVDIGQRRSASVNIRSQKLFSRASNRVFAWHPDKSGFPRAPADMTSAEDPRVIELAAGLRIFIIKTIVGDYWAGWLRTEEIKRLSGLDARFDIMLSKPAGHIHFDPRLKLDVTSLQDPFKLRTAETTGAELPIAGMYPSSKPDTTQSAKADLSEDVVAAVLFQDDVASEEVKRSEKVIETFDRNRKAVRELKKLYKTCQVTGDEFVFNKSNGEPYLEVHHLVPLGEGGSDSPANLVVISAHIHRMLHYADVEGIDLSKVVDGKLDFKINGKDFTISWHPEHAKTITDVGHSIS